MASDGVADDGMLGETACLGVERAVSCHTGLLIANQNVVGIGNIHDFHHFAAKQSIQLFQAVVAAIPRLYLDSTSIRTKQRVGSLGGVHGLVIPQRFLPV